MFNTPPITQANNYNFQLPCFTMVPIGAYYWALKHYHTNLPNVPKLNLLMRSFTSTITLCWLPSTLPIPPPAVQLMFAVRDFISYMWSDNSLSTFTFHLFIASHYLSYSWNQGNISINLLTSYTENYAIYLGAKQNLSSTAIIWRRSSITQQMREHDSSFYLFVLFVC